MAGDGGDYVCHHEGVEQIETEVVTHAKEFLTTFFSLKFITKGGIGVMDVIWHQLCVSMI